MKPKLELISHKLCPFVQRSVITLKKKQIDFKITFIDLMDPPDWFLRISPLHKVPVLKVDGRVLFESAIINMYLDEITPPTLEPVDPLLKAENRAWIEYCSDMLMNQYKLMCAEDEAGFKSQLEILRSQMTYLSEHLGEGPFFNGQDFSLVDTAYAPLLMRFEILKQDLPVELYKADDAIGRWSAQLHSMKCVTESVVDDFKHLFREYFIAKNSYYAKQAKLHNKQLETADME